MSDFGVITEQGDMNLGFSPITEEEKEKLETADTSETEATQ